MITKTGSNKGNVIFKRPDITFKLKNVVSIGKQNWLNLKYLVEVKQNGKNDLYDAITYNVIENKNS